MSRREEQRAVQALTEAIERAISELSKAESHLAAALDNRLMSKNTRDHLVRCQVWLEGVRAPLIAAIRDPELDKSTAGKTMRFAGWILAGLLNVGGAWADADTIYNSLHDSQTILRATCVEHGEWDQSIDARAGMPLVPSEDATNANDSAHALGSVGEPVTFGGEPVTFGGEPVTFGNELLGYDEATVSTTDSASGSQLVRKAVFRQKPPS